MDSKEWMKWLSVLFGLAILVVPFFLQAKALTWTLVILGLLVVIIGAWALGVSKNGWYEIILGLIALAVPFFFTGSALTWTEVIVGAIVAIVGYTILTKK